ncbi:MAG: cadmium-translocating P-type ATPase [Clostridia bacterium]|nr:cadmium-translocating P-type ATPase [Clostridia bacterium]MBQ8371777.1 cadmium-translocating P-type ATPase [Clostridia bacterium]
MKRAFKYFLKSYPLKLAIGGALFIPALILEHLDFTYVALGLYIGALAVSGFSVFFDAVKGILRLDFLDEKFLMTVASIGAFIIGEHEEGVAVMLFFLVGEWFEHISVRRSRKSIRSLMEICPDTATVLRDGVEYEEDAEDVEVGEAIIIRSGQRVPIDAEIISGFTDIDTSALTGESVPRGVGPGDTVSSGTVVIGGVITCRTLRPAGESAAARVLELVENATENKSREESFITKFSRFYTPAVIALAVIMAVLPSVFGWLSPTDAIYRALSFLVISCPCALVISVPMAFFGGIGAAASEGILYKGGNTFSPISRARRFAFDKTGTLTVGELSVKEAVGYGVTAEELVRLAASAEYASDHPVALCLRRAAGTLYPATDLLEIPGKGVTATVDGSKIYVGNLTLMSDMGVTFTDNAMENAVYVARDGSPLGYLTLYDTVKEEAGDALRQLKALGAEKTYIISGDKAASAGAVGAKLGIDEVHAELLPEDKYAVLENIIAEGRGTVYVGDGINDAPSLARADVGIAMGSMGTDSAIEAADVVIMSDELTRIPTAVRIARKTLRIAKENIVFAIGVKLAIMTLVSLGIGGGLMWMAVFADVGVAVLAILNSMRTMLKSKKSGQKADTK